MVQTEHRKERHSTPTQNIVIIITFERSILRAFFLFTFVDRSKWCIIKALSNNNNEKLIKRIIGAYIPIETAHLNDSVLVQCRLINGKLYKYTVCHNHKMGKSPLCSHCLFCLHSNICIQTNNIRISLETQQIKILLLSPRSLFDRDVFDSFLLFFAYISSFLSRIPIFYQSSSQTQKKVIKRQFGIFFINMQ